MLKMYHQRLHKGDSPEFWEENWKDNSFEEALRFCENDPLRPLFERYARPGTAMLEGGCGQGHYVAYYASRGVRVVGLDFAQATLAGIRARYGDLMLCAGDVAALPFRDEAFDLYYSGGVVEHFEPGAEPALQAARRVLRPDGVLLISVPYLNPLRRTLTPMRKDWSRVSRAREDNSNNGLSGVFFQYAYTVREFTSILDECGLRVIERQPYAILWGLYDLPLLQRAMDKLVPHNKQPAAGTVGEAGTTSNGNSQMERSALTNLVKSLIVSENINTPVAGLAVRFLRWASANMMMYVCARKT